VKPEWYYIVKPKKDLDVLGKVEEEVDGDPEGLLLLHHEVLEFLVQQLVLCLVTDKKSFFQNKITFCPWIETKDLV
jgi:hypothetical protein